MAVLVIYFLIRKTNYRERFFLVAFSTQVTFSHHQKRCICFFSCRDNLAKNKNNVKKNLLKKSLNKVKRGKKQ